MAVYSEETDGSRITVRSGPSTLHRDLATAEGHDVQVVQLQGALLEFGGPVLPRPVDEHASGSVEHWDLVRHDQDGASSGLG